MTTISIGPAATLLGAIPVALLVLATLALVLGSIRRGAR
jgi:hypothetical protein